GPQCPTSTTRLPSPRVSAIPILPANGHRVRGHHHVDARPAEGLPLGAAPADGPHRWLDLPGADPIAADAASQVPHRSQQEISQNHRALAPEQFAGPAPDGRVSLRPFTLVPQVADAVTNDRGRV